MPRDVADLVVAAKEGDRAAFDELVRATHAETYTLARRLTGNEEDARDVTQEAYFRAYKGLKRFRGDAQFSTWMYRITANCAATHLGRRNKHRHDELPEQVVDEAVDHDPEAAAEALSLRSDLDRALADLSPKLRSVVILRDVYDLPHESVAAELGISESAAKVRLHRARQQLKDRLFGRRDDDERVAG